MTVAYIIAGPRGLGNVFRFYSRELLPDGRYAIVRDGEYTNGGQGPSTVDGKMYRSEAAAREAMWSHRRAQHDSPSRGGDSAGG